MQKYINIVWKSFLVIIIAIALVVAGNVYSNRDKIVTSKIAMNYFVNVMESNDKDMIKSFVANSNNDVLHSNFNTMLDNVYYYEGVEDLNFKIEESELFGDGKYQCYFSNAFEKYVPKCDLQNEGRYMNYLLDVEVSYMFKDERITRNEKGLVVFVKDMVEGNYFTWKLVRFDRYKIEA